MEDELITIPLTLENGMQVDSYVIAVFDMDRKSYIALLPIMQEGDEEEILIYQYKIWGDEDIELKNIDDEDEWREAVDQFVRMMEDDEE